MTHDEIQKEWDSFIEYPNGSGKLYVTTTSALLFARCIADMAADKERETCASLARAVMLELDSVAGTVKHFNNLNSLEKNGYQGTSED